MRSWPIPAEPWPFVLGREFVGVFAIEEWQALDGMVRFRGRLLVEPEVAMTLLSQRMAPFGYVPIIRSPEEITLIRLHSTYGGKATTTWRGWPLNLALLLATVLTTLFVGAIMEGAQPLADPWSLILGVPFSASLVLILGCHELGHYLVARAYGVHVSLPYFIP